MKPRREKSGREKRIENLSGGSQELPAGTADDEQLRETIILAVYKTLSFKCFVVCLLFVSPQTGEDLSSLSADNKTPGPSYFQGNSVH